MKIINASGKAGHLHSLQLAAGDKAETYKIPGQYVIVQLPEQAPLYLAIASTIGASRWDLLFRTKAPLTSLLSQKKVGEELQVSEALGRGYPMDKLRHKNLILVSMGMGLVSFYSLIHHLLENRNAFGKIALYHGNRYQEDIPYEKEFEHWRNNGIDVSVTLTQPTQTWTSYVGRVQHVLSLHSPDLRDYVALICGHEKMIRQVSDHLVQFGLERENIYTNY